MSQEKFDAALLRTYRALAHERPLPGIDMRLLRAAEAQALKQRVRRHLAPLAAAMVLVFFAASSQRMHGTLARQARVTPTADVAGRVTAGLLHMQPTPADRSTVADFLLDPNSLSVSDAETNDAP